MEFYLGRKNENYWNRPMDISDVDTIDYGGDVIDEYDGAGQTEGPDEPAQMYVNDVGTAVMNLGAQRVGYHVPEHAQAEIVRRDPILMVNITGDDHFNSVLQQSSNLILNNNRRFVNDGVSEGEIEISFGLHNSNNDIAFLFAYLEDFINSQRVNFERKEMSVRTTNDNSIMNISGLYLKNFSYHNEYDYLNVEILFGYDYYNISFDL